MGHLYGMALHEGEPAKGVAIKLLSAEGKVTEEGKTDDEGSFVFPIEEGTWTVQWTTADGETNEGQVEVAPGEDAEVELEV